MSLNIFTFYAVKIFVYIYIYIHTYNNISFCVYLKVRYVSREFELRFTEYTINNYIVIFTILENSRSIFRIKLLIRSIKANPIRPYCIMFIRVYKHPRIHITL